MNIIVAGCGRLGAQLAQLLDSDGYHVAVIDKDKNAFKRIKLTYQGKFVEGIAFDKNTLLEAGIERADALASTTNGDNTNIVTALIAKNRFQVPIVIARIYDPLRAEIYRRMGIANVSPTLWGANKIRDAICHPNLYRVSTFGNGEVEVVETEAPVHLEGRYVKDVSILSELNVVSIVRNGSAVIPSMTAAFQKGDIIFFAATPFGKTKLEKMLNI